MAIDVAMGQPMGQGLGTCLVAVRLARLLGLDEPLLLRIYDLALLRHSGCTAYAREAFAFLGDEVAFRSRVAPLDMANPAEMVPFMLRHLVRIHPPDWVRDGRAVPAVRGSNPSRRGLLLEPLAGVAGGDGDGGGDFGLGGSPEAVERLVEPELQAQLDAEHPQCVGGVVAEPLGERLARVEVGEGGHGPSMASRWVPAGVGSWTGRSVVRRPVG